MCVLKMWKACTTSSDAAPLDFRHTMPLPRGDVFFSSEDELFRLVICNVVCAIIILIGVKSKHNLVHIVFVSSGYIHSSFFVSYIHNSPYLEEFRLSGDPVVEERGELFSVDFGTLLLPRPIFAFLLLPAIVIVMSLSIFIDRYLSCVVSSAVALTQYILFVC